VNSLFSIFANETLDLYQVISENAPDAIKTGEIKNHFGRKVAIVSQISETAVYLALNND
jgi:flap endonuclease-1